MKNQKYVLARVIEGVSINGREFVLEDDNLTVCRYTLQEALDVFNAKSIKEVLEVCNVEVMPETEFLKLGG